MNRWQAERLDQLPPYLFVDIDRQKREAIEAGKDVINLGIGDPDQPTHEFIVDRMANEIRTPTNHRYPAGKGTSSFVDAITGFMKRRFGIDLPRNQVTALIGSKEGIGHLPLAVVNPGDTVLVPEPGYPVYTSAAVFAGATPYTMPLTHENHWLPDLDAIPSDVRKSARLMFLNYPNNPTGATATTDFFKKAVEFARENDILLAHDAAYTEIFFESKPPSILEVEGAADVAIEFHSLSKSFNMTGWRAAFAIGNTNALSSLAKVKDNVDSGQFNAIQGAAAEALNHFDHINVRAMTDLYRERRDVVIDGLRSMGINADTPQASFYVWARCPSGYASMETAAKILADAAVVVIPGLGFGQAGDGYFRFALTVGCDRMREALDRIKSVKW
jgi:LL-diaminopimelate aminotransferase